MHHFALGVLFTPARSWITGSRSGALRHCSTAASGCVGGFPCSGDALRGCLGLDLRRQIIHTMTVGLSGGRRLASYDTADTDPARLLGKLTGGCKIVAFALSMPKFDKKGILRRKGNGDRDEQAQTKRDSRHHVYD